ncbi:hypothetical protein ABPG75_006144 [Micractinium tetrahymenae]
MAEPACHKAKSINFLGRRVPVLLQDVNGPCPLLAIANVLLLRNQLQLPAGVGEVLQDRLVAMVAERLLDSNAASLEGGSGGPGGGLSEEQRASLAHNLSDAIGLLPKLCTGIDVNLRFHDISGFEYTQETAVFDLLDIPLVHGWLVDPQDEPTAHAVGTKSYNELVVQLVTALGSTATPKQLTPCASLKAGQHQGADGQTPRASSAVGATTGGLLPAISEHGGEGEAVAGGQQQAQAQQQRQARQQGQFVDAEALSAALRNSLRFSQEAAQAPGSASGGAGEGEPGSSGPASARSWAGRSGSLGPADTSRAASSLSSLQASDSMKSMVNRMLTDLVSDAFTSGTPLASRSPGHFAPASGSAAGLGGAEPEEGGEEATSALRPALNGSSAGGSSTDLPAGAVAAAEGASGGGLEAPLGSSPVPSGTLEWQAELGLEVDEAAAAAGQADAVRVRLTMRAPRPPPSPFDLSPSASAGATASQQQAGAPVGPQRSTPATPHTSLASMAAEQQEAASATAPAAPGPLAAPAASAGEPAAASGSPGAASAAAAAPGSSGGSPGGEAAVRDALLVQQFLEGSPSQLTFHGLVALQEGLRPNQLAVFFRNNHFNTLFKGPDSQLYILATDEGFQFESDVVWEHLISVDGDTELVGGDFRPFQPHTSHEEAAAAQAAARQDDWDAAAAAAAAVGALAR